MTDGIHIPRDVAEAEGVPQDLDAGIVGPYRFPDPRRRRIAGWIYLATAALLTPLGADLPLVWVGVALTLVLAVWHLTAAWPLDIDQEEALSRAAAAVDFTVGHASAAVTFAGSRSRPQWHVVLYSADEPPSRRALVQLDGVTSEPTHEVYIEDVPPLEADPGPAS
jgi:hypothetical protein